MAPATLLILASIALFPTLISAQDSSPTNADLQSRADLIPWSWTLPEPLAGQGPSWDTGLLPTCPSPTQSLVMFMSVNIIGAVLSLLFGNRRITHVLSLKVLGGPQSRSWILSVGIQTGFHLAGAFVNAFLISRSYGDVHIAQLGMLLLARPRLSWIPLTLLLAKDTYRNTAISTMCTEVLLELFGTYSMGVTVHFASQNGYYSSKIYTMPHGSDALLMYCGALLFLVNMAFSICAAGLGVRVYYNLQKDSSGLYYRPAAQEPRYSTYANTEASYSSYNMNSISIVSNGDDTQQMIRAEESPIRRNQVSVPKHIAAIVFCLSISCAGSWMFWIGFTNLAGPLFCLPNVIETGALLLLFSILSVVVGTGFS